MGALYKLQAKAWFANMFNKMDFVMTFMFLAVLGSFISLPYDVWNDPTLSRLNITMISSIALLMVASSAINTFGISFFEMKESVLLKRIGATEITQLQAIASFVLWGMTSMLLIIGWMALLIGICQIPAFAQLTGGVLYVLPETWKNANWIGVIVAILITMISFYAIAMFFVSITGNSNSYQIMSTFYFFLISFLGGAYTPNADIVWMNVISFLSPMGWGRDLMTASMNGSNVFNLGGYHIDSILDINTIGFSSYNDALSALSKASWDQVVSVYNHKHPLNKITLSPSMDGSKQVGELLASQWLSLYATEQVNTFSAIGNIAFPVIYGTSAGLAAAKFFKWD